MAKRLKAVGKVDASWQERNIRLTPGPSSALQTCHFRLCTRGSKDLSVTGALFSSPLEDPDIWAQHPYAPAPPTHLLPGLSQSSPTHSPRAAILRARRPASELNTGPCPKLPPFHHPHCAGLCNLHRTHRQSTEKPHTIQFRTAKPYHAVVRLSLARHATYICGWW